jgi:hypothetical protein
MIRILLFRSVGRDDVEISDLASFWHFVAVNEEHGVGAFDAWVDFSKSLGEASDFERISALPESTFTALG